MHLWPSLKLRDSFKSAYLKKLEWNLHRMNSEKQNQTNQQKLLDQEGREDAAAEASVPKSSSAFAVICREVVLVLSCCYCCFCCGACADHEEN